MEETKVKNIALNQKNEKLASYHFCAPKGWINDPNGVIFYKGNYHIFYQYNPNENYWNNISIGVAKSKDLLKYDSFNVALAPTKEVDGIFSGSITALEDGLHLIFTKHVERNNYRRESISAGFSLDGITFNTDFKELVDEHSLPLFDSENFRDPYIYKEKDTFYLFIASRDKEDNLGKIFVLRSKTLSNFKYYFEIGPLEVFGEMVECPAIGKIDNSYVLVFSKITKDKSGKDIHSTGYLIMDMDLENAYYAILKCGVLDGSKDFYAPQLFVTQDNKLALISWFNSWDYKPIEQDYNLESCGIFTYPRLLEIENGSLVQKPLKEIQKHVQSQFKYYGGFIKTTSLIKLVAFDEFKIDFVNEKGEKKLELLYYQDKLHLRSNDLIDSSIFDYKDEVTLLIMLDNTSCEIFINHGKETMSKRVYFNSDKLKLDISKKEHIDSLIIAELDI